MAGLSTLFDMSEAERVAMFKIMGAVNVDPPLEHTKFVRIKANGRILPWNPLLADQTTLVENCDENGNTDRAAWEKDIVRVESDEARDAQLSLLRQAKTETQEYAGKLSSEYRVEDAVSIEPRPTEYPEGVAAYEDVCRMLAEMEA